MLKPYQIEIKLISLYKYRTYTLTHCKVIARKTEKLLGDI